MSDPTDLASLATCAGCGQGLRPATTNSIRRGYECDCPAVMFDADDLDEAIVTAVLDLLVPRMRELFTPESLCVGWRQATPAAQMALARIELVGIVVTATDDGFDLAVVGSPDLSDSASQLVDRGQELPS